MLFYMVLINPPVRWLLNQIIFLEFPYSIIGSLLVSSLIVFFCKKRDGQITAIILENAFFQWFLIECILTEFYFRKDYRITFILSFVFLNCIIYSNNSVYFWNRLFFFFIIVLCFFYHKLRSTLLVQLFKSKNCHFFIFFNSAFYRKHSLEACVGWIFIKYLIFEKTREKRVFKTTPEGMQVPLTIVNKLHQKSFQKLKLSFFEVPRRSKEQHIRDWGAFILSILLAMLCTFYMHIPARA